MLKYADITQNTLSKGEWSWSYWPETFDTLTGVTRLLITKYILKLAGCVVSVMLIMYVTSK
jgi:hypothetical protein